MADAVTFNASSANTAWAQGTGEAQATQKQKSKADQDLEKIRSKAAQELAKQQAAYQAQQIAQQAALQQQQQAQQQAASLAQQKEQESWQSQWNAAQVTGTYNGQQTLAAKTAEQQNAQYYAGQNQQQSQFTASQSQQNTQFGQSLAEQQAARQQQAQLTQAGMAQEKEIKERDQALAELSQQQQNAVATGNLELSREIQTKQLALQSQQQEAQNKLQLMQTSGYMENGQLTEAARAAREAEAVAQGQLGVQQGQLGVSQQSQTEVARNNRVQAALQAAQISGIFTDPDTGEQKGYTEAAREFQQTQALQQASVMGHDASGNLTEAARATNLQTGLQYAQMQAQLQQNPEDYFKAAALQRNAGSDVMGFLQDVNNIGTGSSSGFRGTMQNLPQTNSMQNIAGQTEGPSQSLSVAQNAAMTGAQGAYTAAQNKPAIQAGTDPNAGAAPVTGFQNMNYPTDVPPTVSAAPQAQSGFVKGQIGTGGDGADGGGAFMGAQAQMGDPSQLATTNAMPDPGTLKTLGGPPTDPGAVDPGSFQNMNYPSSAKPSGGQMNPEGLGAISPTSFVNAQQGIQTGVGPTQDVAQQRLQAFAPIFKQGAQKMAPGALAAMSPTERGLFNSAAKASGINPADFEQSFNRSRLQTNMSAGAI